MSKRTTDERPEAILTRSAIHLLHRTGQVAEVVFTHVAGDLDLTPRQFAVLAAAAREPNISQIGLVRETGIDRSTLADIVKRLIRKGLLQRQRTKSDARMYAVRLTPRSQEVFEQARRRADRADEALLSFLPAADRAAFLNALRRLIEGYENAGGDMLATLSAPQPANDVSANTPDTPPRARVVRG